MLFEAFSKTAPFWRGSNNYGRMYLAFACVNISKTGIQNVYSHIEIHSFSLHSMSVVGGSIEPFIQCEDLCKDCI